MTPHRDFRETMVALYSFRRLVSALVEADLSPLARLVNHRSDALFSVAVALPRFDAEWFTRSTSARPVARLVGLAGVAIIALLVASAAHRRNQRARSRGTDDHELFTATPLPMPREHGRQGYLASQQAFGGLRLPRWLQVGSLVIALAMTWVVSQRILPGGARDVRDGA